MIKYESKEEATESLKGIPEYPDLKISMKLAKEEQSKVEET